MLNFYYFELCSGEGILGDQDLPEKDLSHGDLNRSSESITKQLVIDQAVDILGWFYLTGRGIGIVPDHRPGHILKLITIGTYAPA